MVHQAVYDGLAGVSLHLAAVGDLFFTIISILKIEIFDKDQFILYYSR